MADNDAMSHRCWNCGQQLAKGDVLHAGVLTGPRVYFHRVAQRHQRGYRVWGSILAAAATLWFVAAVLITITR